MKTTGKTAARRSGNRRFLTAWRASTTATSWTDPQKERDQDLTVTVYAGKEVPDALKSLQSAIDVAEVAQDPSISTDSHHGLLTVEKQ